MIGMTETSTHSLLVDPVGPVDVTLTERGSGRPYLLLHGGGGPLTVAAFADLLAETQGVRVITPVHPGFNGTPRPDRLATIGALAATYVALLADLDLDGVVVVGNSIGGWIAAEMALLDTSRVSGFVLVDAVGIEVAGHPVVDFFSLTMSEVADVSYHDPDKFRIDVSALPPAAQAAMAANRATLATYGGTAMTDPTLAGRLGAVTVPTLVVWGEADRIADSVFGQALADAIPGATFTLMAETGHLPQLETPERLVRVLSDFATNHSGA
ncbi:alpha/beta hydrolase [Acidothermaceae bacterium B102]|nr:alpha/beta hydrolase [Acidothermaceae bacterium B102]